MGYAHGELMQENAKNMMNDVWNYLEDQVVTCILRLQMTLEQKAWLLHPSQVEAINGTIDIFPKWFLDDVTNVG